LVEAEVGSVVQCGGESRNADDAVPWSIIIARDELVEKGVSTSEQRKAILLVLYDVHKQ
jgi:hypothetical protein